jgi:hypothetical protein
MLVVMPVKKKFVLLAGYRFAKLIEPVFLEFDSNPKFLTT